MSPPFIRALATSFVVLAVGFTALASTHGQDRPFEVGRAIELVQTYCLDCHQGDEAEGGLDLEGFQSVSSVTDNISEWNKIVARVRAREMPPADSDSPSAADRDAFVDWIQQAIKTAICDDGVSPGPPTVRRMNRTEYGNTLRDLLGIQVNVASIFPNDGAGGEGFDNASETLFISPIYAEKYMEAAKTAVGHALADPENRKQLLVTEPSAKQTDVQAATAILTKFLPLAFRRPVRNEEINEYIGLFNELRGGGESYSSAIELTLVAVLVSPKFLFLGEQADEPGKQTRVTQHEFANRLSYFLWASMPDKELFDLASQGKLFEAEVLGRQVARMLRSDVDRRGLRRGAKVRDFAESFIEQWLGTRALGREFVPDSEVAPRYNSELEGGMKYEPVFFFEDLLAENRSLLNFLDSNFTYVNRSLASHYRIRGSFREQPKFVHLEESHRRGGVLGMGAVLAVSSYSHRTSPVLRGKWILETILGTPPPPPPEDVPDLEESANTSRPQSLREKLELHREDSTCASCHDSMDPLGFGLENYDLLGKWRSEVDGVPIDATGKLPSGEQFNGPNELKAILLERKDQFVAHLTRKVLGYALGRGLTNEDQCVVEEIAERVAEDDYRAQTLILEIVSSVPFQYKMVAQNTSDES